MRTPILILAACLLAGCSTLNRYGIGGEPLLYCRKGQAVIDDRIAGPDQARLAFVRRFKDADALCSKPGEALGADLDAVDTEVAVSDSDRSWGL
jgi:hypothetical protein